MGLFVGCGDLLRQRDEKQNPPDFLQLPSEHLAANKSRSRGNAELAALILKGVKTLKQNLSWQTRLIKNQGGCWIEGEMVFIFATEEEQTMLD